MIDSTAEFFQELGRRGHEPLLEKGTGTIRFDLVDGKRTDHWLVTLDKGDVFVTRKSGAADCVVRTERTLFDAMAKGKVNGLAAYLRGELALEGDPELLVLIQRVLPAPPTRRSRRGSTAGGRNRR
jgi:putative sterol carrier protein